MTLVLAPRHIHSMQRTPCAILLLLLAASRAGAAPIAFDAQLEIVFSQGGLGTISASASGVTEVEPTSLAFGLPAGLFLLDGSLAGPVGGPVAGVRVQGVNQMGSGFGPFPPVWPPVPRIASMPLSGTLELSLRDGAGTIALPLSVIGALSPAAMVAAPAGTSVTLRGHVWASSAITAPFVVLPPPPLTGTSGVIPTPTTTGDPPLFVSGLDARNDLGIGLIQRVTPVHIIFDGDARAGLSGYARLSVEFVPEPDALALIASGLVGLAATLRRARKPRCVVRGERPPR